MATRPHSFESIPSSGSEKSQLGKYVGGDMKLPENQRYLRSLIGDIVQKVPKAKPEDIVGFVDSIPRDMWQAAVKEALGEMETRPHGILDQAGWAQLLGECMRDVKKKYSKPN